MRRKDREMDEAFAWDVFDRAPYAVLAVTDGEGAPYCVPVSPARIGNTVYFHCAREGKKTDAMDKGAQVCLSAVSLAETAGWAFSMEYESAVLRGIASDVDDREEKLEALRAISRKYAPDEMARFDAAAAGGMDAARVVRIGVQEITGKKNRYGGKEEAGQNKQAPDRQE